ncbi:MAG TPA: 50S ribosomal protein L11 methyltransferase, partial [Gaiellaceae bacterium]|nr:50S ribosomal protein L11 methyltransferase [Gaiellaceae bacterium]
MLEIFPEGFEEIDRAAGVELAAYTDAAGEERMWAFFGNGRAADVESGWEDRWRAFHRPVRVGRLWVGPPWEAPADDALVVVVDPGRAFGTGSHQTTQLCLAALQELEPGSLLDVGCGSGVLSVAAALLGFGPVTAVDVEEPSIAATRANAAVNHVSLDVRLVSPDTRFP